MTKAKKIIAVLVMTLSLLVVSGTAASAAGPCAPGQHGNPEPGFKPPSCPRN